MRRLLVVASLLLLAATPSVIAAQTFEGIVTAKVHAADGREATEVIYALRGGVMRMEMATRGDMRNIIIVDTPAKTNYVLMPPQKTYMAMPFTTGGAEAPGPPPEIIRTGRKETIAGHTCEHWLVKDPSGDLDVCVAAGLGAPFTMGAGMGREPAWTGALRDQRGFPLKVARAGGATILEVTKIERKTLDPALFAPPADYKKMELPTGRPARPPRQ